MSANLIGTWTLADFFVCKDEGIETPWLGHKEGTLIYTEDGRVSAYLKRDAQPGESEGMETRYDGTYNFVDDRTVEHKVEYASDLERVGKILTRHFEMTDQQTLVITGENKHHKFRIIWKKEP